MPPSKNNSNLITDLRSLTSQRVVKQVNFMGKKIEVNKLTLAECMEVQKLAKNVNEDNPEAGFGLLREVIRMGVPAAADFTDEDFESFPMEELNNLSNDVLKYAGMTPGK